MVRGNAAVLIENGSDVGEFVVGIDFVIGNGGLLGKFVFEDESFLILLTCILRINHGNFCLNFNYYSSEKWLIRNRAIKR